MIFHLPQYHQIHLDRDAVAITSGSVVLLRAHQHDDDWYPVHDVATGWPRTIVGAESKARGISYVPAMRGGCQFCGRW